MKEVIVEVSVAKLERILIIYENVFWGMKQLIVTKKVLGIFIALFLIPHVAFFAA